MFIDNAPRSDLHFDDPRMREKSRMIEKYSREVNELNRRIHTLYMRIRFGRSRGYGACSGGKKVFDELLRSGDCRDYGDENVNETIIRHGVELYISIARDSSTEIAELVMELMLSTSVAFPVWALEDGRKLLDGMTENGWNVHEDDHKHQAIFLQNIRLLVIKKLMSPSDASVQNLQGSVHQKVSDANG